MDVARDGCTPIYRVPGTLTIYDVSALEGTYAGCDVRSGLCLDLQSVEEIDGAGIQWLLAVRVRLERNGSRLELVGTSESVMTELRKAGVAQVLAQGGELSA